MQQQQVESDLQTAQQAVEVLGQLADLVGQKQIEAATKREEEATAELELETKKLEEIKAAEEKAEGAEKQRLERERKRVEANVAAKKKAEEQAAADRIATEKRVAAAQKSIALAQAFISTALAVNQALAQPPGPPATIPFAVLAGVLGAVQIAAIASQQFAQGGILPTFADGGVMQGPRHSAGGINLVHGQTGRVMGQIEGGEPVLTRGVAQNPLLLSMAGLINQMGGGVNFAAGGVSPAIMATGGVVTSAQLLEPTNDIAVQLAELRTDLQATIDRPIYTVVTDVTESQARQTQLTENRTF